MAQVEDISINDMQFQSSAVLCKPEDVDFPVVIPGGNIHRVDIKTRESGGWKKTNLKRQITPQKKKELYLKLDEILLAALHEEFEMSPGHTIDRLEMIQFLTSVVHQHLSEFPDLKKVLDLRDTVLTGRVKKAFPEVEYKRKQIRQEHYRKVWLYVNIRRKSRSPDHSPAKTVNIIPTSPLSALSTPGPSTPFNQASSSPSSPVDEDHKSYEHCNPTSLVEDDEDSNHNQGSPQSVSGSDNFMSSLSNRFSCGSQPSEGIGLSLDNLTLQKWVISRYAPDNTSYVPVQDVVKAFRKDYNVDLSYKECHQMILSAFTCPRNRVIPRKTVRVSSLGQQYVYRGIIPINKATDASTETQDADGSQFTQSNCQSESPEEEYEETWKQRIRDITDERDQALMERNQALAALMELEKEHGEAKRIIERLKKETLSKNFVENSSKTFKETSAKKEEIKSNHREGSSLENLLQKFGDVKRDGQLDTVLDVRRDRLAERDENTDRSNEQCDHSFFKEVVTQAKEERDCLLKRLEIVKSERNSYLDRLHSLEKENQRLKDAVSARQPELSQSRLLDDISRHFQANSHGDENNAKEALSSALSHLKSKRKQVTPSRLNKSPKYEHSHVNESQLERNSFDDQKANSGDSPSPASTMDSGVPSPGNQAASNGELFNEKEILCNADASKISNDTKGILGSGEWENEDGFLVFTSGSEMIGFTRHPLED